MAARSHRDSVSAVVLAGGKSSRMGQPKALLPFDHEPLLVHIVRLLQQQFADIVIVAAPGQELPPVPGTITRDEVAHQGPVGGICYGLQAARGELCFVTSCDAPFLNLALVSHLLSLAEDYDVVAPHWQDRLQPLHAVYRRGVAPLLREQLERGELRPISLYKKVRTREVLEDEVRRFDPEGLSFRNLNSPEDYQAALTLWQERKGRRSTRSETKPSCEQEKAASLSVDLASTLRLTCTVELFGVARLKAKTDRLVLSLPLEARLTDALAALAEARAELVGAIISSDRRALLPGYACNLNGVEFVRVLDTPLHDGDHLLILSSDAGG